MLIVKKIFPQNPTEICGALSQSSSGDTSSAAAVLKIRRSAAVWLPRYRALPVVSTGRLTQQQNSAVALAALNARAPANVVYSNVK